MDAFSLSEFWSPEGLNDSLQLLSFFLFFFFLSTFNRFLEEKKMDSFVLNLLNEKVVAIGRVLLLENDFLHGEVQWLLREKAYIRKLLQYVCIFNFHL